MTEHRYRPRTLEQTLADRLRVFPVVVLTSARQTGKSTLARRVEGGARTYLTLDDYSVLDQAAHDPDALVARGASVPTGVGSPRPARLTLDEVQRAPELLLAVKRAVDADRSPGRFLLTGSSSLDVMRGVSDSLAGRAVCLALGPMTRREVEEAPRSGGWSVLVDETPDRWLDALEGNAAPARSGWPDLALRGGYPVPALHLDRPADREVWFESYVQSYLERDLRSISAIDNLIGFRMLMRAVAIRVGGVVNQAGLARDAGLAPTTAQRYLHLLEASYRLLRVEAYMARPTRRLVSEEPQAGLERPGTGPPRGGHGRAGRSRTGGPRRRRSLRLAGDSGSPPRHPLLEDQQGRGGRLPDRDARAHGPGRGEERPEGAHRRREASGDIPGRLRRPSPSRSARLRGHGELLAHRPGARHALAKLL